jgi:hypothetical protein
VSKKRFSRDVVIMLHFNYAYIFRIEANGVSSLKQRLVIKLKSSSLIILHLYTSKMCYKR